MDMQTAALDAKRFRRVMGKFATGVTVITYQHEGQPAGMTANAFMSLSVDPPMVLVSIRKESRFAAHLRLCGGSANVVPHRRVWASTAR